MGLFIVLNVPVVQLFCLGALGLLFGDESVLKHALNDVLLAGLGASWVVHGVVGRRRLGKTREHGGLCNSDRFQGLAKISLCSCCKAICALPQIDLVQVDLKNLVLGEQVLKFQGQQNFVDLSGESLLRAQVHVSRHLHGDGGSTLALGVAQIGQTRTNETDVVNASVLVKACVLDRQDGILHHLGNVFEGSQVSALFTEFANLFALNRINPHGELGAVIGEVRDIRQLWIGHGKCHTNQEQATKHKGRAQANGPGEETHQKTPEVVLGGVLFQSLWL